MPNWYKHIDRIGVELEGGFHPHENNMTTSVYGDGSVEGVNCCYELDDDGNDYCVAGEVATVPLKSWGALRMFFYSNFPEHVNSSCGTHLHISTKTIAEYNTVLCKDFYESFVEMLTRYGDDHHRSVPTEWMERLDGGNEYCEDYYRPERQLVENRPCDRYSFLNYCYRTHGTFEIRVLPAFDNSDDLLRAIKYIVPWVNKYIDNNLDSTAGSWDMEPIRMLVNQYPTNIKERSIIPANLYDEEAHIRKARRDRFAMAYNYPDDPTRW